jgi:hypothetical protein
MLGKMENDSPRPKIQTVEVPPDKPSSEPAQDSSQPQILVEGKKDYSKHFAFVVPAFLLIITIVLVGYGVNWYISSRPKPTPVPAPAPTLIPATPTPTPEAIVKDKIYTNLGYGFSFKYSEDLNLLECDSAVYLYNGSSSENVTADCSGKDFYLVAIDFAGADFYPAFPKSTDYEIKEISVDIAGVNGVRQEIINDEKKVYLIGVTFSENDNYFLIKINRSDAKEELDKIVSNFEFVEDVTKDWLLYSNLYYSIKYPPDWRLQANDSGEGSSIIAKNADEKKLQNLVIDFSANVANANLTASEVISSTKNLSGWVQVPSVDIRNIGGGTAQILQGQLNGDWHTFVVIWYKNRLVQIVWFDNPDRGNQELFDNMLSSFKFVP